MDKEKPEASPSPPEPNMELIPSRELKDRKPSNNILIYLIDRQLGRPRNDLDLFEWVWTIT
ncbi:embryonic testis differentiation protein-like [Peromyscus californicus insignis]|uniref:embryonic testis differentiation protein-like n=1 Tax=Peromyscus californicus insignis TaxID=564181 RepID=UPI0022A6DC10|nr:embryonic testis differentiation protein-like [Peromyscus californicus insignis]